MSFLTAAAVLRNKAQFDLDKQPERWHVDAPFDALDIRPGRVVLIGAPPAAGKTTLTLQLVTNILERQPNLKAVIGNVETAPVTLIEKLLARFANVPLDAIMNRMLLDDERDRVEAAMIDRVPILERIGFLEAPFTIQNLIQAMQTYEARLAVIDYVQRFTLDDGKDARLKLDALMNHARILALAGAAVILISSVARQRSSNGSSTYSGLNMASFRGSAELEFGADSAYVLNNTPEGIASLQCVKNRFGTMRDIPLRFCGEFQRFDAGDALDGFDAAPTPTTTRKGAS